MTDLPSISQNQFLKSAYSGKLQLWKVFWLLYSPVLLGYVALCASVLWLLFNTDIYPQFNLKAFLVLFLVVAFFITITITSLVWLCAKNTKTIFWAYLAKAFILFVVTSLGVFVCFFIPLILGFETHGI
ncbi:hypothetical protein [Methylophilus sp. Q8]|uniref:hypothetical protein n=1 Tax=Methylophilus sp. Q8 TaxID=1506586 RepID=UPI000648F79B|nr:hypothetical protein [Methylophilus sp. Q8]